MQSYDSKYLITENRVREGRSVGQFGEKLRRERELRDIKLEEMSAATKIGTRALRALEEERFDQLPGGIFNKGFVRAYARYVGINEEEAVSDYIAATKNLTGNAEELNISLLARQVEATRAAEGVQKRGVNAFVWALIVVIVVFSIGIGGWPYLRNWWAHRKSGTAPPQAAAVAPQVQAASAAQQAPPALSSSTTPSSAVVPQPAAPTASAVSTSASETAKTQKPEPRNLSLVISAKERSWVEVTVDGKVVLSRILDPNSSLEQREQTFQAKDKVVLVTGNAAGLDFTFNGQPFRPSGRLNVRRVLTFTSEGVEEQ